MPRDGDGRRLLIFGASARAAAFSALRAGLTPCCVDRFADADLRARCAAERLKGEYPAAFAQAERTLPPGPWLYVGGLENHPRLVGEMAARRLLWGNDGAALERCRQPAFLRDAALACGLPAPELVHPARAVPGRRYLLKPLRGAGGRDVRFWSPEMTVSWSDHYLQGYVEGAPTSAQYLAVGGTARLLGMTRQLVGESFCHAKPFAYCGSVGPLPYDLLLAQGLARLGHRVAAEARLRGLFGIDGVLGDEGFWPVEINPRYTASMEVLEYAAGLPALLLHRLAFEDEQAALTRPIPVGAPAVVGKAVLFAPDRTEFPAAGPWTALLSGQPPPIEEMPAFADVPDAGSVVEKGAPVLTILEGAGDLDEAVAALRRRAAETSSALGWPAGPSK
jgi:predicted ATP-grasp superfamily ATP-dependent carboligase